MKKLLLALLVSASPVIAQTEAPASPTLTQPAVVVTPAATPTPITEVVASVAAPTVAPIIGPATKHYFRLLDPHHLQMSAGTLYDLHGLAPVTYVTDLALVTHSTKDGSIIPSKWQQLGLAAEDWTPLQLGAGGSAKIVGGRLTGNAVVAGGTSFNACPWLLGWAVKGIGSNPSVPLQVVKAAIVGNGTTYPKLRLGYVLLGNIIVDGTMQSAKEAFPGSGVVDIVNRAGRLEAALGWNF